MNLSAPSCYESRDDEWELFAHTIVEHCGERGRINTVIKSRGHRRRRYQWIYYIQLLKFIVHCVVRWLAGRFSAGSLEKGNNVRVCPWTFWLPTWTHSFLARAGESAHNQATLGTHVRFCWHTSGFTHWAFEMKRSSWPARLLSSFPFYSDFLLTLNFCLGFRNISNNHPALGKKMIK